ncbi:MAG: hypothetical protein LBT66_08435 [Methanobrevibacter sp.]|nr:hypothetical protein [Candidatus Methanovirga meridionalis]
MFDFHNYAMFHISLVFIFVLFFMRFALTFVVFERTYQFETEGEYS